MKTKIIREKKREEKREDAYIKNRDSMILTGKRKERRKERTRIFKTAIR